jgi:hypothetical protein
VHSLRADLGQAKARADKAEKALADAVARQGKDAGEAQKAEAAARELLTLKTERSEIRNRIEKLVSVLESI